MNIFFLFRIAIKSINSKLKLDSTLRSLANTRADVIELDKVDQLLGWVVEREDLSGLGTSLLGSSVQDNGFCFMSTSGMRSAAQGPEDYGFLLAFWFSVKRYTFYYYSSHGPSPPRCSESGTFVQYE